MSREFEHLPLTPGTKALTSESPGPEGLRGQVSRDALLVRLQTELRGLHVDGLCPKFSTVRQRTLEQLRRGLLQAAPPPPTPTM